MREEWARDLDLKAADGGQALPGAQWAEAVWVLGWGWGGLQSCQVLCFVSACDALCLLAGLKVRETAARVHNVLEPVLHLQQVWSQWLKNWQLNIGQSRGIYIPQTGKNKEPLPIATKS